MMSTCVKMYKDQSPFVDQDNRNEKKINDNMPQNIQTSD